VNNVKPKNPLLWIKYRYLEWRWERMLAQRSYSSWEQYLRRNDVDFDICGKTVREQFCGFAYVAKVDHCNLETHFEPLWGPVEYSSHILEWCEHNCRGKYRHHWERVIQDHNDQYLPNDIGGTDELFFGFKDERDYLMFVLRWS
jgi:hypothetical protein